MARPLPLLISVLPGNNQRAAPRAALIVTTATRQKWKSGATPKEASRPPHTAPSNPPPLNAAWNDEKTGWPSPCSTTTPCAFMATSSRPLVRPSAKRASMSVGRSMARAGRGRAIQYRSDATRMTIRLLRRVTSQPASDWESRAPIAIPHSANPSIPVFNPRCCWIAGIRGTQLLKTKPLMKNTTVTARRAGEKDGRRWVKTCSFMAHLLLSIDCSIRTIGHSEGPSLPNGIEAMNVSGATACPTQSHSRQ